MSGEVRELAEAVDALSLSADTAVLAEALAVADRLRAKLARAAAEVDAHHLWVFDGAVSLTGWLRQYAGMTNRAAGSFAKTARRLRDLPVTAEAWAAGALSGGQVEVIIANMSDRNAAGFAETEARIVPSLAGLDLVETITAVQAWRRRIEALLPDVDREEPERSFHLAKTLDGRYEAAGSFDADSGAVVEAALRLATTADADGEERTPAERRADAEVAIHQHFLDHQRAHRGGRRRPHVDIVVELTPAGPTGRVIDGSLLPRSAVERYLCDCAAHRVLTDGQGAILDYGRATRTVPVDLFNALVLRDGHCRHPGCDRPPDWCDAHHVKPWEEGGPTCLDNLVLKCRRHHLLGHQPGWHDKLLPDGTYEVTDPRGRHWATHPPGALTAAA